MRVLVVGAGPAGLALATLLKGSGYAVSVYEMNKVLGLKPCGGAVPVDVRNYVAVPEESVVAVLRGHRVFLDGELLFERLGRGEWGYVIDRRRLLEEWSRDVDLHLGVAVKGVACAAGSCRVLTSKGSVHADRVVVAAGGLWPGAPKGPRINALQYRLVGASYHDDEVVELHFDSKFVGYAWVFPEGRGRVRVGVGGFMGFRPLRDRLNRFVRSDRRFRYSRVVRAEGGSIVVSGVVKELLTSSAPAVGEAAGAVFPLSGEGIRPSVVTAWALAEALRRGESYERVLDRTLLPWRMSVHRRMLAALMKLGPEFRAYVLKTFRPEDSIKLGLGLFDRRELAELMLRYPRVAYKVLTAALTIP